MKENSSPIPNEDLWNPILDELDYWFERSGVASLKLDVGSPTTVAIEIFLNSGETVVCDISPSSTQEFWEHAIGVLAENTTLPPLLPMTIFQKALILPARVLAKMRDKRFAREQKRQKYQKELFNAQTEADQLFRLKEYQRVIEVLQPFKGDLDLIHVHKLNFAVKKSK